MEDDGWGFDDEELIRATEQAEQQLLGPSASAYNGPSRFERSQYASNYDDDHEIPNYHQSGGNYHQSGGTSRPVGQGYGGNVGNTGYGGPEMSSYADNHYAPASATAAPNASYSHTNNSYSNSNYNSNYNGGSYSYNQGNVYGS